MQSGRHNLGLIVLGLLVPAVLLGGGLGSAEATGHELIPLYVTVDKSRLIALEGEPFRTVAVTNPHIADVQVLTPNQILINGKGVGATSLVVFYREDKVRFFDVVVNPSPVMATHAPLPETPEPHTVLVHRADKMTSQLFVRDQAQLWVELGGVKPEKTEDGKK